MNTTLRTLEETPCFSHCVFVCVRRHERHNMPWDRQWNWVKCTAKTHRGKDLKRQCVSLQSFCVLMWKHLMQEAWGCPCLFTHWQIVSPIYWCDRAATLICLPYIAPTPSHAHILKLFSGPPCSCFMSMCVTLIEWLYRPEAEGLQSSACLKPNGVLMDFSSSRLLRSPSVHSFMIFQHIHFLVVLLHQYFQFSL